MNYCIESTIISEAAVKLTTVDERLVNCMDYLMAAAAFLCGTAISFVDFRISKYFLRRGEQKLAVSSMLRQTLNVAYLVILFLLAQHFGLRTWLLLLGGALGLTIPSVLFTAKLLKASDRSAPEKEARHE